MKTVKKKEGKIVQAFCLEEKQEELQALIEKGLIRQEDAHHWRVISQESRKSGVGQLAETGDYIKIDSTGMPYPNSREFFLKKHRPLGNNQYEQIPEPLKAWDVEEEMCPEIRFLMEHKGLVLNTENEEAYFQAPLWGDLLTAAKDSKIVFYSITRDRSGQVTDADFNFVTGSEFEKTYLIL